MNLKKADYERYKAYSEYSFSSSEFKKLDYIVESIQKLSVGASTHLLDLGCGNGNVSTVLASFGHDVLGIDPSEDCIRYATSLKSKYRLRNCNFQLGNASDVQRLGRSFDAVICSEVLEHAYEPISILFAAHAVLKQDGILIVTVPNGYGPFDVSNKLWGLIQKNKHIARLCMFLKYRLSRAANVQSVNIGGEGNQHVQFFTKKAYAGYSKQLASKLLTADLQILFRA